MIVGIRGANTRNKGAELMLRAIAAQLDGPYRGAVAPWVGSYDERARLGLLQRVSNRLPRAVTDGLGRALPGRAEDHLLHQYGLVFDHRLDAMLDASGFAYSEQFDTERCELAAAEAQRFSRAGRPFVLLPQAFGPFRSPRLRDAFTRLVDHSRLVFAREQRSLEHIHSVGCRTDHVKLAPDFTCLLAGEVPDGFRSSERLALVVPSAKLLTETSPEVREAYLPFLANAVAELRRREMDVRLVLHERDDLATIAALQKRLDAPLAVERAQNAVHLKGIIGEARVVVGSRFHALVSALSQGVPALGVGWSHKYEMLFADYGCAESVVDPRQGGLPRPLESMVDGNERDRIVERLRAAAEVERARTAEMWSSVMSTVMKESAALVRSQGVSRKFAPSTASVSFQRKTAENLALLRDHWARSREPVDFTWLFDDLDEYDRLLREAGGPALRDARVLEIGYGARPWRMLAMRAMSVDAVGVDAEVPVLDGGARDLALAYRRNGIERTAKSLVRHALFDRKERRACDAALRARSLRRVVEPERFAVGDAADQRYGAAFDLIVSEDVFEHIVRDSLDRLVPVMAGWLRPSGIALIRPNIFTGITGGHLVEWNRRSFETGAAERRTRPWAHLHDDAPPPNTFLNRLTRQDYRELFAPHFDSLAEHVALPDLGREYLTGETAGELAAWSEDELFSNQVRFVLRPNGERSEP